MPHLQTKDADTFNTAMTNYFKNLDEIFVRTSKPQFVPEAKTYSSFVCFHDFVKHNPKIKTLFDKQEERIRIQMIETFIATMMLMREREGDIGYYIPDVHIWTNYEEYRDKCFKHELDL